jgi:hypothetical protein
MNERSKITASHLSRQALVYLRQSSAAQVEHNRESTERQYALATKAAELGWTAERVIVIDEDLGLSGSGAVARSGFARLTAITRPRWSYGPVRHPPGPPRRSRRWSCELQPRRASPDYPYHPSSVPCPHTPADRTGACVNCFPVHAAFPVSEAGRHPQLHFRGLLRLHSRYGPLDCSTAQGGLRHEASARPLPLQAARQLPDQSTTLCVESSSTGVTRLRGALKNPAFQFAELAMRPRQKTAYRCSRRSLLPASAPPRQRMRPD